jgi:hypothetical protein
VAATCIIRTGNNFVRCYHNYRVLLVYQPSSLENLQLYWINNSLSLSAITG